MALKITGDCVKCGACECWCENQAISEGDETYVIAADRCTECVGVYRLPKCLEICPLRAVKPDPEHRETRQQLMQKWQNFHPGGDSPIDK